MSSFYKSSIGQKFFMSITGLFLIVFLLVHLSVNSLLVFDTVKNTGGSLFNAGAHFMATNPLVRIMEPLLGIGFLLHILYGAVLSWQNFKARGSVRYKVVKEGFASKWASRNMLIIGGLITVFLFIHLANFWWKMKFTGDELLEKEFMLNGEKVEHAYNLVAPLLSQPLYAVLYIIGAIFLGLHLYHAFWSAFQTLGLSNSIWRKRLEGLGLAYTLLVAGGFAFIGLFFLLNPVAAILN